jgi:hypothetical protein
MTELEIHFKSTANQVSVRFVYCCSEVKKAHEEFAIIDSPFYALALTNQHVINYCPFCGAKIVAIDDLTGKKEAFHDS